MERNEVQTRAASRTNFENSCSVREARRKGRVQHNSMSAKCPREAGSKPRFSGLGHEERRAENVLEPDNGDGCTARERSESHCCLYLKMLTFTFCEFHPNKKIGNKH